MLWSRFPGMRPLSGSGDKRVLCLAAAVLATLFALMLPAPAVADSPGLVWTASIDGHDVRSANRSAPLELGASDQARVEINLDNRGTSEIRVRSVRIEGRVIGMAFFSYTTRLDIVLPPGDRTQRRFDIDISDLTHQATGLLPASVILIAPDRTAIADQSLAVDVPGSVVSVYGAFGLIMAGITAVVLAGLLVCHLSAAAATEPLAARPAVPARWSGYRARPHLHLVRDPAAGTERALVVAAAPALWWGRVPARLPVAFGSDVPAPFGARRSRGHRVSAPGPIARLMSKLAGRSPVASVLATRVHHSCSMTQDPPERLSGEPR